MRDELAALGRALRDEWEGWLAAQVDGAQAPALHLAGEDLAELGRLEAAVDEAAAAGEELERLAAWLTAGFAAGAPPVPSPAPASVEDSATRGSAAAVSSASPHGSIGGDVDGRARAGSVGRGPEWPSSDPAAPRPSDTSRPVDAGSAGEAGQEEWPTLAARDGRPHASHLPAADPAASGRASAPMPPRQAQQPRVGGLGELAALASAAGGEVLDAEPAALAASRRERAPGARFEPATDAESVDDAARPYPDRADDAVRRRATPVVRVPAVVRSDALEETGGDTSPLLPVETASSFGGLGPTPVALPFTRSPGETAPRRDGGSSAGTSDEETVPRGTAEAPVPALDGWAARRSGSPLGYGPGPLTPPASYANEVQEPGDAWPGDGRGAAGPSSPNGIFPQGRAAVPGQVAGPTAGAPGRAPSGPGSGAMPTRPVDGWAGAPAGEPRGGAPAPQTVMMPEAATTGAPSDPADPASTELLVADVLDALSREILFEYRRHYGS